MRQQTSATARKVGARSKSPYTSRLQKGGALLDDMRLLVGIWAKEGPSPDVQIVEANLLGKRSRIRSSDTLKRVFLPRFVNGSPPDAWRLISALEDKGFSIEVLRPIYYWVTARSEPLLYDYVVDELYELRRSPDRVIRVDEATFWIQSALDRQGTSWSDSVTLKVARGLLACLRDFGLLEGASRKHIAPVYLPVESFAYIAFALFQLGVSADRLVEHRDWRLFFLQSSAVEHLFIDADRAGLLHFQAAGRIVRIDFPAHSWQEMANVIASRTR